MDDKLMISPEGLEIANMYLQMGSADEVAYQLNVPVDKVATVLDKAEVRRYIDNVYLDKGYRNRFKLGALLDEIIDSRLAEVRETELYTNKDLVDIIKMAHQMRMDEAKLLTAREIELAKIAAKEAAAKEKAKVPKVVENQTNVQINEIGGSNYMELMQRLLGGPNGKNN